MKRTLKFIIKSSFNEEHLNLNLKKKPWHSNPRHDFSNYVLLQKKVEKEIDRTPSHFSFSWKADL